MKAILIKDILVSAITVSLYETIVLNEWPFLKLVISYSNSICILDSFGVIFILSICVLETTSAQTDFQIPLVGVYQQPKGFSNHDCFAHYILILENLSKDKYLIICVTSSYRDPLLTLLSFPFISYACFVQV